MNMTTENNNSNLRNSHEQYLAEKAGRRGNIAFELSRKRKIIDFSLLVVSALLYSAIFPPFNLDFYAWFSLIPLFFLVRGHNSSSAFFRGWIWGCVWAASSFFWLREIEFFIPFLLAPIMALFPAVWCAVIPLAEKFIYYPGSVINKGFDEIRKYRENSKYDISWNLKGIHFALILSAFWVCLEWGRGYFLSGFPWNLIAVSQWRNLVIIQIADITGIYGVGFIILLLNICLGLSLEKLKTAFSEGKFRRPWVLYFASLVIMLSIGYGTRKIVQYKHLKDSRAFKLAVIQADIPQCRASTEEQALTALEKYIELSELALLSAPDIVVWPETAVPIPYRSSHPVSIRYQHEISRVTTSKKVPFLLGSIEYGDVPFEIRDPKDIPVHNSCILVGTDGKIVEKYHKTHLVPFGEYTPFGNHFSKLKKYFGMGRDLTPGRDYTIFELPQGISAGVNICFEDIFPEISRKFTKKGADILFVLTNDAWYPKSSEPEQHFAQSVFRAVENRRYIIRSGNNSFSSLLSPIGMVEESITYARDPKSDKMLPDPSRKTSGYAIFQAPIQFKQNMTFYTEYGDIFILACFIFLMLSAIEIFWKWKNCKQSIVDSFVEKIE